MSTNLSSAGKRDVTAAPVRPGRRSAGLILLALALALAVGAVAAAYGAWWLVLAGRLEAGLADWIAERRAQGYHVSHGAIVREGFPEVVRLRIEAPTLSAPPPLALSTTAPTAPTATWTWSTNDLTVALTPWDPRRVTAGLAGRHRLHIAHGDGRPDARVPWRVEGDVEDFTVKVDVRDDEPAGVADLRHLSLKSMAEGPLLTVAALTASVHARPKSSASAAGREPQPPEGAGYGFALHLRDAVLPGIDGAPLGQRIERLVVDGALQGEPPRALSSPAIFDWRDRGGAVDIERLDAAYGPLAVSGSGTVALDQDGQPVAAFSARVRGLFTAIDRLRDNGYLEQSEAMVAKMGLHILAGSADRDAALQVPVSVQNGVLSVGPVDLLTVPKVRWPQTATRRP